MLFLFFDYVATEVFAEHVGNVNTAVGVLVLLYKRGENTACSKAAAVEYVAIFDLAFCCSVG